MTQKGGKKPHHWFWDDTWPAVRRELLIATTVAGSLTLVLLARRWASAWLGQGLLNQEIFAGSTVVNELVGEVERRIHAREEADVRSHARQKRRARTPKRGPTNGTANTDGA